MTTENLTPEEMQLIELRRKEAALKKEQEEIQAQLRLSKDIEYAVKHIDAEIAQGEKQVAAAQKFFNDFSENYELKITETDKTKTVEGKYTNPDNPRENNYEREVLWKKEYKVRNAYIKHKLSNAQIFIKEHFVYSKFSSENKGFKMFIFYNAKDTAYTNTKTVMQKIEDNIKAQQEKAEQENKVKNAKQQLVEAWSNVDGVAECKEHDRYIQQYHGKGYTIEGVKIKTQNGIEFHLSIGGTISDVSIRTNEENRELVIKQLAQIKF
jgi:hypothetical protein